MKQTMEVLVSSETNEWYTDPGTIALVKRVLGPIELDPATCKLPQMWIKAKRYFTVDDDGLAQDWGCRTLFMNPPYGKTGNMSNQEIWMDKLITSLPRIGACIALTKTVPGYQWWTKLWRGAWPGHLCITDDRLAFVASNGTARGKSKAASSFWYYGPHADRFQAVFDESGRVVPTGRR